MELQRGQVVRSLAGHDQGDFQVVVAAAPPLRLCVRWKAPALTAAQAEEAIPPGRYGHHPFGRSPAD